MVWLACRDVEIFEEGDKVRWKRCNNEDKNEILDKINARLDKEISRIEVQNELLREGLDELKLRMVDHLETAKKLTEDLNKYKEE